MYTITDKQADALRAAVEKPENFARTVRAIRAIAEDPPWARPKPLTLAEAGARSNANLSASQRAARRANAAKASKAPRPGRLASPPSKARPTAPGWYVREAGGAWLGPFRYRSFAEKRLRARPGAEVVRVDG